MFEDWVYLDMTDFASALDYECEHPSWQSDWRVIKPTEFPALTVEIESEQPDT